MKPRLFATFVILVIALASPRSTCASKAFSYFRVGNPSNITTTITPGAMLMGGGTDVDAGFQWMCQRSGGGDFLVIRATGTDAIRRLYLLTWSAEQT